MNPTTPSTLATNFGNIKYLAQKRLICGIFSIFDRLGVAGKKDALSGTFCRWVRGKKTDYFSLFDITPRQTRISTLGPRLSIPDTPDTKSEYKDSTRRGLYPTTTKMTCLVESQSTYTSLRFLADCSANSIYTSHLAASSSMVSFLHSPPPTAPPSPTLAPKQSSSSTLEAFTPLHGVDPIYTGSRSQLFKNALNQINVDECDANGENAFFVADLSEVYRQHLRWIRELPRVVPFYAVKCNPDPYVLRLLAALGCGFDCASNGEIGSVLDLGISPQRIVYANPCKAASFVRNAAAQGVTLMTFDNLDELDKIKKFHPDAKLVVRILTDDSKSVCQLGLKFGAPMKIVSQLLQRANELELDVVGVSFHVGSGCYDPNSFRDAVDRARNVFDMAKDYNYEFDLLDVGGGYAHDNFEMIASVLRKAIDEYFPDNEFAPGGTRDLAKGLRIIGEPGRYYVQRAFSLAANIIARRDGTSDDNNTTTTSNRDTNKGDKSEKPQVMYYQNDGVYGAFNCIMFDHQSVQPKVLTLGHSFCYEPDLAPPGVSNEEDLQPCSVWGPTCDSIDCVREMVRLPKGLQVSDWLIYEDMGAYTICAASGFNGLRKSEVRYTIGQGADSDMVRKLLE